MLVSCPTTNPPAGVLYNHVSKTGGTSLIQRLKSLLVSPDMPLVKAGSREEMSQIKLGRDGALVAQVDTEPIQVIASSNRQRRRAVLRHRARAPAVRLCALHLVVPQ